MDIDEYIKSQEVKSKFLDVMLFIMILLSFYILIFQNNKQSKEINYLRFELIKAGVGELVVDENNCVNFEIIRE